MKRRKSKRGFDCVGFKRKAQAEIYQQIKGLSAEAEIEYFRRWSPKGPLAKWWKALESRSRSSSGEDASSAETPGHQLTTSRVVTREARCAIPAQPRPRCTAN